MRIIELLQVYELVEHNNGILTACVVVGSEHVVANAVYDAGLSCPCDRVLCPVSCNVGEVSSLLSLCVLSNAVEDSYDLSTGDLCSRIKVAVVAALDVAVLDCPCNCGLCVILNVSLVAEGECLLGSDGALQTPQHGDEVLTGDVSGREEVAIVVALDDAFLGCPCNCVLSIIPDGSSVLELRCYNGLLLAADGADTVLVLVAECGDHFALLYGLVANGADLVAGVAGFGAGSSLCVLNLGLVAECRDFFASLEELAAPLADGVAGVASLSAGCVLCALQLISCNVGNSRNNINHRSATGSSILATNSAVLNAQAIAGAGGLNDNLGCIAVISRNFSNLCGLSARHVGRSIAVSIVSAANISLAIIAYESVIASINIIIGVANFIAGSWNVSKLCPVVASCRDNLALASYCPALVGPSEGLSGVAVLSAGSCNCRNFKSLANSQVVSVVRIVVLVKSELVAAEVLFADAAIYTIGLAVMLASSVDVGVVAFIAGLDGQCIFMCIVEASNIAGEDGLVMYNNGTAIRAVCVASMTLTIAASFVSENLSEAYFVASYNCFPYLEFFALYHCNMGRLYSCMILDGAVCIVNIFVYSYELVGINVTSFYELVNNSLHLSIGVLLIGRLEDAFSDYGICNEYRILAVLANSIAPAILGASGLYKSSKVNISMTSCLSNIEASSLVSAAICAVSKGNTLLLASCCLELYGLPVVAECCALINVSLFRKRSYLECLYFNIVRVAVCILDAGLLCSGINRDVDGKYITIRMGASCQCGSRNQRCDHENSH